MNRILVIGALLLSLVGMGYLVYHQTGTMTFAPGETSKTIRTTILP